MSGIVVIGVGNRLRGDDAVGPAVIRYLAEHGGLPEGVDLHSIGGDAADLIDLLAGVDVAIICDAVNGDASDGSLVEWDCVEPLPGQMFMCSSHSFGVAEGIELARNLGQLPKRCFIVGVSASQWELGADLSEAIERVVPEAGDRILQLIGECLALS